MNDQTCETERKIGRIWKTKLHPRVPYKKKGLELTDFYKRNRKKKTSMKKAM